MVWEGLAAGALGAGASLAGGILANSASAKSAKLQMQFQEKMFRNRYRMTMADMRAAGLNPILAGNMGVGTSPTGASYQAQNVGEGVGEALAAGASSARSVKLMKQELRNLEATEHKINEEKAAASALALRNRWEGEAAKEMARSGAYRNMAEVSAKSAKQVMAILKNEAGSTAYKSGILRNWLLSGARMPSMRRSAE